MWRKYDSDSKNYLVSPTSESNKPPSGTGSSFEILRNEKILTTTRWGLGGRHDSKPYFSSKEPKHFTSMLLKSEFHSLMF